jgi:uncharacterized tellurite resistance protein B-like protein
LSSKQFIFAFILFLAAAGAAAAQDLATERAAQQILVGRGYDIGPVDGIWGRRSIAAMTDLQRKLGLPQTGQPDAATLDALAVSPTAAVSLPAPARTPASPPPMSTSRPPDTPLVGAKPNPQPAMQAARPGPALIASEETRPGPFLVALGIVTFVGALAVYLISSLIERRRRVLVEPKIGSSSKSRRAHSEPEHRARPQLAAAPGVATETAAIQRSAGGTAPSEDPAAKLLRHNAAVDAVVRARAAAALSLAPAEVVVAAADRRGGGTDLSMNERPAAELPRHDVTVAAPSLVRAVAGVDGDLHTARTVPSVDEGLAATLRRHNAAVDEVIRARNAPTSILPPMPSSFAQTDDHSRDAHAALSIGERITARLRHNAAVDAFVRARAAAPVVPPPTASARIAAQPVKESRRSPWVPGYEPVTIGHHRLPRGFVYVGEYLKPQNGWGGHDNCLIVPSLPIASRADISGQYLDYWRSYERLPPSSRKAYLDWLSSDRSNPETPIGYVFLYFYGLERRLMLERDKLEREAMLAEVERLVGIYGDNGSFRRYSAELLSAARLLESRPHAAGERTAVGLGNMPIGDRVELGRRAVARQPISPSLLLSLAANHPETRLRSPARRLPELAAQRFYTRVESDYPEGVIVELPANTPALDIIYRAASGTFEVPIMGTAHSIPDIMQLAEPLGYARAALEAVTDELDGYSREVGRANGAPVSIAGLTKLPAELRRQQAMAVARDAITRLDAIAGDGELHRLAELLALVGLKTDVSTKAGLRDLAQCLAEWGIGIVPDPSFAPKILAGCDAVLAFPLDPEQPARAGPSDQYRLIYVSLALGVVVANADGSFAETERNLLLRLILEAPRLGDHERRRLAADLRWLEVNPLAVSDLRQFLKGAVSEVRTALMRHLAAVALADGTASVAELDILEKIGKILEIEPSTVYQVIHSAGSRDGDLPLVEPPSPFVGPAIPARPKPFRNSIDAAKLAAIRAETADASSLLNDIFADEGEAPAEAPASPLLEAELDQRHHALLDELMTRPEWSRQDFERLARRAGSMPGSVISVLNDWSIDRFDELLLEGDDPIVINGSIILQSV